MTPARGPGGTPPGGGPLRRTAGSGGLRNTWLVARREYGERVRSRAFVLSTLLLAALAAAVALLPIAVRLADRATVTRVAVVAAEPGLADRTAGVMDGFLNGRVAEDAVADLLFEFEVLADPSAALAAVREGRLAALVTVERRETGGLVVTVASAGALSPDRAQLLQVGAFATGILDWTASQPAATRPFVLPEFSVVEAGTGGGATSTPATVDAAEYAGRRVVGIVFVVLAFLTLVFYGLWVAAGTVAEKANRVMELLISAATAPQLVVGKITGIGLAGLTQVSLVLAPAVGTLAASEAIATAVLGPGTGGDTLAALSPGLVAAFFAYFVLGFALYAALYAAAGSLLSRAEDLQIVALPLSLPALAGYLPAVLALSGGSSWIIRLFSLIPIWSPFVMLARLSTGNVEPWEVALSLGLLLVTVPLVTVLAVRVYRAGVLLYGQPPGARIFLRALRGR